MKLLIFFIGLFMFFDDVISTEILSGNKEIVRIMDDTIEIVFHNTKLHDVIDSIQENSGIEFYLSSSLREERITVNIISDNWTIIIQKLFNDFNRIEVLGNDGLLKSVKIVSRFNEGSSLLQDKPMYHQEKIKPSFAPDPPPTELPDLP